MRFEMRSISETEIGSASAPIVTSRPSGRNPCMLSTIALVEFEVLRMTSAPPAAARPLPSRTTWAAKYKDAGQVVIGVHTPEFAFEKERSNVEKAVLDLKVSYPVAIDSDYKIWQAFNNQYWPGHYFIDGKGRIRHHHFGEGEYEESEQVIQQLLKENGTTSLLGGMINVSAVGVEAAPGSENVRSPETYIGYRRAENFASAQPLAQDSRKVYTPGATLSLNQWALGGSWNVSPESAVLQAALAQSCFG